MAVKKLQKITTYGMNSNQEGLGLLLESVNKELYYNMLTMMLKMQEDMKGVIKLWVPKSKYKGGELLKSIVIDEIMEKNRFKTGIRSTSPYAGAVERGTVEHWVPIVKSGSIVNKKLHDWSIANNVKPYKAMKTGDLLIRVGGPPSKGISYVNFGSSDRRFFTPVLRHYVGKQGEKGEFDKYIKSGIRNALNNFERRAGAGKRDNLK